MNLFLTTLLLFGLSTMNVAPESVYHGTVKTIDGKTVDLSSYAGSVCLIVNVASYCGYTKQYGPLEELYKTYHNKGFVILGFPSNDFGAQEPGTDDEIKEFCSTTYHVTFPMFSKVVVKGSGKAPLFDVLTRGAGTPALAGEIGWNFEKFLVGRDGKLIKRYGSKAEPMGAEMRKDIEAAL